MECVEDVDNTWKSGQAIPWNGRTPSFYKRHAITGWKKKDGSTDRCVLEAKIQSKVKIVSSQTDLQFRRGKQSLCRWDKKKPMGLQYELIEIKKMYPQLSTTSCRFSEETG